MNEFQRLMEMEGVSPLGSKPQPAPRAQQQASHERPQPQPQAQPQPGHHAHVWVSGPQARNALETALRRLSGDAAIGKPGWAIGIRQDGSQIALAPFHGAPALLAEADRQKLRLIIVGGSGWTCVMHPQMGIATLDMDPID